MRIKDALSLSWQNIFQTPMRSILTILGLSIGIGAILTVLSLGSAGQAQVETEIMRLGVDKVWITAAYQSPRALSPSDARIIRHATGVNASGRSYTMLPVAVGNVTAYAQITGCDEQMDQVNQVTLLAGRFLSPWDHQGQQAAVVMDQSLCQALVGEPQEALGIRLNLAGRLYQVVGVIADQSVQTFGASQGAAYIPFSCFEQSFSSAVDEITLSVPQGQAAQELADLAVASLNSQGLYEAVTLQQEIDAARSVIRIFVMVLACVAAICMLVGGIGVMNILLVSVRERRREIGVIKALGGTKGQVCLLFLLEAVTYALMGGLAGIGCGVLLIHITSHWIGLSAAMDPSLILPAMGCAGLIGVFFGVFPAFRAASLVPVEALRQP
ncbi:MAG: ABC transporter permease [Clostridia bacterium]|nr:ABC transporter permease [Clostridia bacterium]